jgi:hypothetical protein
MHITACVGGPGVLGRSAGHSADQRVQTSGARADTVSMHLYPPEEPSDPLAHCAGRWTSLPTAGRSSAGGPTARSAPSTPRAARLEIVTPSYHPCSHQSLSSQDKPRHARHKTLRSLTNTIGYASHLPFPTHQSRPLTAQVRHHQRAPRLGDCAGHLQRRRDAAALAHRVRRPRRQGPRVERHLLSPG